MLFGFWANCMILYCSLDDFADKLWALRRQVRVGGSLLPPMNGSLLPPMKGSLLPPNEVR